MLLVVEYGCSERILSMHSQMRRRDDHGDFGFLGKDRAHDASFIAGLGDLRDNLLRLDNDGRSLGP